MNNAETEEHIDFVRKVLGIVSVQLTFTFALCVLSSMFESFGKFFKNPAVLILFFILCITCVCVISASKDRRRRVPENYLWLAGATLGEAGILACTSADLKTASVFFAIMATCIAVCACFCAALYSSSTMDRGVLIRNMVKFAIYATIIDISITVMILLVGGI